MRQQRALILFSGLAVVLLAAGLRFWALDFGLPHTLVRPDETPVLERTLSPAQGEFDLEWSIYPHAYVYGLWLWGEGVARTGALVGAWDEESQTETLRQARPRAFLIARALSALAGIAAVAFLFVATRRSLGDVAALVAALLLAVSFLHVRDSHAAKSDTLLSLGVIVALAACAQLSKRATPKRATVAGATLGVAMAAKYPAVVLVLPAMLAAVLGSSARGWRRYVPLQTLLIAGAASAFVFLATSPYLVLNSDNFMQLVGILGAAFPGAFPGLVDHFPGFPATMDAPPRSAYAPAGALGGFVYHARFSLWYGAGMLVTVLAPFAVAWGFACRRPLPLMCAVFSVSYYVVIALSPAMLARYVTPLLAPLFVLEAGLLLAIARRLAPGRATAVALGLAVIVAAEPLYASIAHNRILSRTDTRVMATEWIEANLPADARIAAHGTRFWPWGKPSPPEGRSFVPTDPDLASFDAQHVEYWLTHDHPLFFSSVDPELQARLAPRLQLLAEFSPYDPARAEPIFESADAYYAPYAGFRHVERAGPMVRIYAFEPEADRG